MTLPLVTHRAACSGTWQQDPGFGVYVHIPFCAHRCHYCDFNTYEGQEHLHSGYVDALVADIERAVVPARNATSVFFGGGTPTLLPAADLSRILAALDARVGIAPGAEITVEANPETLDEGYLQALVAGGFNRISIGVQSTAARVLAGLGRTHTAGRAVDALVAAHAAGFSSVNADLIFGSQWESAEDWVESVDGVVGAGPDHISAYALTVETGTPLHTMVATGRIPDVDPDVQAERFEIAQQRLGVAGYRRYEVSNWARAGHASRHNVLYWSGGDYLGFGAGAHGHVSGHRWWNVRLPRLFAAAVARGATTVAGSESLSPEQRAGEALMLGLRLTSGIEINGFVRRFGAQSLSSRESTISSLESAHLLECDAGTLRLAADATFVANEALCRLL